MLLCDNATAAEQQRRCFHSIVGTQGRETGDRLTEVDDPCYLINKCVCAHLCFGVSLCA